jgi:neutral ceramidase
MNAWKAGVATTTITPAEPMWLAGWAARREPASGASADLFAKALALEDPAGERFVIVTADLIAIRRSLANAVAARIELRWRIARERILFNASHTHTGPEVRPDKVRFFEIPEPFARKIPAYVASVEEKLAAVIDTALASLEPARIGFTAAHASFAANRRAAGGPVDHDVPVLVVHGPDGRLRAIAFGYACHNLTLPPSFHAYHGDYAGVAQRALQAKVPGATALFLAGAGADQDPAPRGSLDLAEAHGTALADAVSAAIATGTREISGSLSVAFEEVQLELQPLPGREALLADTKSDDGPRRRKAEFLLEAMAANQPLATTLSCPIQVVALDSELLLIALGGEPVVDFALGFKNEFARRPIWVAGYSNDMFGYLPTRRVQREGGYEAGRAALWSALPMPVAETSEERVVTAVRRLVEQVGRT